MLHIKYQRPKEFSSYPNVVLPTSLRNASTDSDALNAMLKTLLMLNDIKHVNKPLSPFLPSSKAGLIKHVPKSPQKVR